MGKLAYTTPVMSEEVFEADEYVAACWDVACAYGYKAGVGGKINDVFPQGSLDITHGMTDKGTGCGYAENQSIVVDANGNVSMTEVDTDRLGNLPCTITDKDWNPTTLNQKQLTGKSVVYWTTTAQDGRTWHHMGYVNLGDASNSNHS